MGIFFLYQRNDCVPGSDQGSVKRSKRSGALPVTTTITPAVLKPSNAAAASAPAAAATSSSKDNANSSSGETSSGGLLIKDEPIDDDPAAGGGDNSKSNSPPATENTAPEHLVIPADPALMRGEFQKWTIFFISNWTLITSCYSYLTGLDSSSIEPDNNDQQAGPSNSSGSTSFVGGTSQGNN